MQPSVINKNARWCYHSVTKTGSQSMEQTLLRYFGGRRVPPLNRRVPDYFHFAVVRDPYDWAVSTWWATCKREGDRYGVKEHGATFEQFAVWVAGGPVVPAMAVDLLTPQHQQLPFTMDDVLMFHRLQQAFARLPFVAGTEVELPHLNTTQGERQQWSNYVTPAALEAVNHWLARDFELFHFTVLEHA